MSWIIIGLLGFLALLLVFSLLKKLVKLAFTVLGLLLLAAGIWYLIHQDPEISETVRQAGEEAGAKLEEMAGDAMDRAAEATREAVEEGAERAMDKAAEVVEEGAEKAIEKAAEVVENAGDGGEDDQEPRDDRATKDGERR